jgi:murein DD-endopeptidase MepM/ murein hydrolase activator NlpD
VLAAIPTQPSDPVEAPPTSSSPLQIPFRFNFPTAAVDSVSLWRPPLYATPWEPTPYDHFYFSRPIGANDINWPLARYRYGGIFYQNPHTGIDIPAPKGTTVVAAGSGKVIWAGFGLYFLREDLRDPYGLAVAIKHDFGYQGQSLYTVYGHMDSTFVTRGQMVKGGDMIGTVGETGFVSGPHLHFEVRIGNNEFFGSRNPELWISPPQGWGILVGRVFREGNNFLFGQTVNLRSHETGQHYFVDTYGEGNVNSDPYYRENLVLGDLPAGWYTVWINFDGGIYKSDMQIFPGKVTFFTFDSKDGFDLSPPPTPAPEFIPPDATITPTP